MFCRGYLLRRAARSALLGRVTQHPQRQQMVLCLARLRQSQIRLCEIAENV